MGLYSPLPAVGAAIKDQKDSLYGLGKLRLVPEDRRIRMTMNGHCFLQGLVILLFSVVASDQGKHRLTS